MAAQISRFSTRPQRKVIKSFRDQIGGYLHLSLALIWLCRDGLLVTRLGQGWRQLESVTAAWLVERVCGQENFSGAGEGREVDPGGVVMAVAQ